MRSAPLGFPVAKQQPVNYKVGSQKNAKKPKFGMAVEWDSKRNEPFFRDEETGKTHDIRPGSEGGWVFGHKNWKLTREDDPYNHLSWPTDALVLRGPTDDSGALVKVTKSTTPPREDGIMGRAANAALEKLPGGKHYADKRKSQGGLSRRDVAGVLVGGLATFAAVKGAKFAEGKLEEGRDAIQSKENAIRNKAFRGHYTTDGIEYADRAERSVPKDLPLRLHEDGTAAPSDGEGIQKIERYSSVSDRELNTGTTHKKKGIKQSYSRVSSHRLGSQNPGITTTLTVGNRTTITERPGVLDSLTGFVTGEGAPSTKGRREFEKEFDLKRAHTGSSDDGELQSNAPPSASHTSKSKKKKQRGYDSRDEESYSDGSRPGRDRGGYSSSPGGHGQSRTSY